MRQHNVSLCQRNDAEPQLRRTLRQASTMGASDAQRRSKGRRSGGVVAQNHRDLAQIDQVATFFAAFVQALTDLQRFGENRPSTGQRRWRRTCAPGHSAPPNRIANVSPITWTMAD